MNIGWHDICPKCTDLTTSKAFYESLKGVLHLRNSAVEELGHQLDPAIEELGRSRG